ncbi:MAG: hypothetical protein ABIJ57_08320 [Pseudomonadota bacterium]
MDKAGDQKHQAGGNFSNPISNLQLQYRGILKYVKKKDETANY